MLVRRCGQWAAFGALLALAAPICIEPAKAAWATDGWTQHIVMGAGARPIGTGSPYYLRHDHGYSVARYGRPGGPLQCVPFARENSGIQLVGNAVNWWEKAVGVYERGSRPEVGSVLNFRSTRGMRLGHVAVVSRVIDSRNLEIDHANWAYPGAVSRAIDVVDVSPQNDWTAVRVELARGNEFGSIYPTYGFIYDRPDRGTLVANADSASARTPNPGSIDGHPANEPVLAGVAHQADQEVAEAPDDSQPRTRQAAYSRAKLGQPAQGAAVRHITARPQPVVHNRRGRPNT